MKGCDFSPNPAFLYEPYCVYAKTHFNPYTGYTYSIILINFKIPLPADLELPGSLFDNVRNQFAMTG